jgi:hypothetical protein
LIGPNFRWVEVDNPSSEEILMNVMGLVVRRLFLFSSALSILVLLMPARADTVYSYTGNPFTNGVTQFGGLTSLPFGPFTASDSVSGSFTVATPLGPALHLVTFTPASFSFTDGVDTLTNLNSTLSSFEQVSTDVSGNIVDWHIFARLVGGNNAFIDTNDIMGGGADEGAETDNQGHFVGAGNLNDPGKWTVSTTVPEPSSLLLLASGAIGLAGVLRKRWLA